MAELQVERKRKTNFLPWVLLLLGLIALGIFLGRRHDNSKATAADSEASRSAPATEAAAATGVDSNSGRSGGPSGDQAWGDLDRNVPGLRYDEIHDRNIHVSGNDQYAIYDLGEDVLFDRDKSTIRKDAATNLKEVSASIAQRFDKGPVRLYGFTDAQGKKASNLQLSQARAEAVKRWLTSNGNIPADRISVEAKGEENPKASNDSEKGRQENRRVQIVVRKAS